MGIIVNEINIYTVARAQQALTAIQYVSKLPALFCTLGAFCAKEGRRRNGATSVGRG